MDYSGSLIRRTHGEQESVPCIRDTVLLNEIQSQRHSSTRRALRSPRPANTGLRNGVRFLIFAIVVCDVGVGI